MSDTVDQLGSLSPAAKDGSSKGTNFFSLSLELRQLVYQCYAELLESEYTRYPRSQEDMHYNFVPHGYNDGNSLVPKLPALMQTSQQVRSEFSKFYKRRMIIKCNDYASFYSWSKGIGLCILDNLYEIHLNVKVYVNVVDKGQTRKGGHLADLRVRCNEWSTDHDGPSARFFFDIMDGSSDPEHYDDSSRWLITWSDVERISQQFEARLPWNRGFTSVDILQLTHWLSGDGVVDFKDPDDPDFAAYLELNTYTRYIPLEEAEAKPWLPSDYGIPKRWNTFELGEDEGSRWMAALVCPPGTCDYYTLAKNLWTKPLAIEDASSQSRSTQSERQESSFDDW